MANTKLSGCLQLVGRMPQKDQDALLARIDELRNGGVSAEQAQFVAADDMLAQILAERADFTRMLREQHPDLFAGEAEKTSTGKPDLMTPEGKFAIAQELADFLMVDGAFKTIIEARKKIADLTGQKIEAATEAAKQADEAIETAVVLAGREIVGAGRRQGRSPQVIYDRLVSLYERQPNLAVRSSTSMRDQAYSTPVPLAYLASELAGVTANSKMIESTAGNGMLAIGASMDNATINELNPKRAEMLSRMGFNPTTKNAATETLADEKSQDAVVINPPFGVTKDTNGDTIYYEVNPGFTTREVDHAIVFKTLQTMKDDGRAVLIVGGVQAENDEARRDDYRGKSKREFYFNLYRDYNVTDHFAIDGGMYSKQGASYPVDVIVINGRGQSSRDLPAAELPAVIRSYDELKGKLDGARSVESKRNVGADGVDRGADQAGAGDRDAMVGSPAGQGDGVGTQGNTGRTADGDQGARPAAGGRTTVRGAGTGQGQSEPANSPGAIGAGQGSVPSDGAQRAGSRRGAGADNIGNVGGPSVVGGERVESGLSDRRGEEKETETQVEYQPLSNAASVGTLVPKGMRDSIAESLQKVADQVGDLDEYVANSLAMEPETLRNNFSAEQIDALALSIQNAEAGKGFIIGDQTGIGKGRVVAAMIRYALINDKVPIFVTEKPNLYSDMIRDLDDIGMTDDLALDTKNPRILITNGDESIPYTLLRTVNGEVVENKLMLKAPKSGPALNNLLKDLMAQDSLGPYKVIFTTYSQMQTVKGKMTERMRFVRQFGAGNYMIFDESHNAGGVGQQQTKARNSKQREAEGDAAQTGRSGFVRSLVTAAFGTFFSSATYAKRPDVMDLYSSTNMKLAVDKISQLSDAIKQGGVPMQQAVATMLTKDGQYIRRERTFAGVSYDTQETKVDKPTAENMAAALRDVLRFSRAKEMVVKQMQKEFDKEGAVALDGGEKTSVQSANFGSIMHNLIDQMLLALKVESSIKHAISRLQAGEKVVLTVSNTMGSFLKDYAAEMGIRAGDPVALSFKDLYLRYLEKQRIIKIKRPGGGELTEHRLTDAELGPQLTALYKKIQSDIEAAGFGSAPISPIDYMHDELKKAGYKTDEITGRGLTLNYQQSSVGEARAETQFSFETFEQGKDKTNWYSRYARMTSINEKVAQDFAVGKVFTTDPNGSNKYVIVGKTKREKSNNGGLYFIAKNLQTGKLSVGGPPSSFLTGETMSLDREYQSELDEFKEAREAVDQLAPKLTSRTSNIRQRVNAVRGFNNGSVDVIILNQAGSTGLSLHASSKFKDQRKRHMIIVQAEKNIDTHMQMLGRVHRTGQVLAPAYSQMMADIPAEMRPAAVLMKKMASLNANTTASRKSAVSAEGVVDFINQYGGQIAHEYLRDNPEIHASLGGNRVLTLADDPTENATEDDIRKLTGYIPILPIKTQETVYKDLIERYNELIDRENSLGNNKLEAKALDLDAETISSQPLTEKANDPSVFAAQASMERVDVKRTVKPFSSQEVNDMVAERLGGDSKYGVNAQMMEAMAAKYKVFEAKQLEKMRADEVDEVKINAARDLMVMMSNHTTTVLDNYEIGNPISIQQKDGAILYGVITNIVQSGRTANPAAGSDWKLQVAIANGDSKTLSISFSQIGSRYTLATESQVSWYNPDKQASEQIRLVDLFDKGATQRREKRWMVTGNLLAGFAKYPGQIVNYTKKDGTTAQGVLMSRQFDFEKEQKAAPVRMRNADDAMRFFDAAGSQPAIGTQDGSLRIVQITPTRWSISVPSSKKDGGTYFLDQSLTQAIGNDFYKRGSVMAAAIYNDEAVRKTINYLINDRDESLVALNHLDKARELRDGNKQEPKFAANDDYTSGNESAQPDTSADARASIAELERVLDGSGRGYNASANRPYRAVRLPDHDALGAIAQAFGSKLVGFDVPNKGLKPQYERFNGVTFKTKTGPVVYLRAGTTRPHLSLLGHELGHRLRAQRPDLYAQLVSALQPYIKQKGYEQFAKTPIAKTARTADGVQEEFIGEVIGDGMMDPDFWRALGNKNRGLLNRFAQVVSQMIRRAAEAVGYRPRTLEYVTDFKRVMEIAGEVMGEFGLNPAVVQDAVKVEAQFAAGEKPPADEVVRLYHAGSDPAVGYFSEVPAGGVFDGFFAKATGWGNYGTGAKYFADIPIDKTLTDYQLNYELDYDTVSQALRSVMRSIDKDDFDTAWSAVVEDKSDRLDGDDMMRIFGGDNLGDAVWEAQRIRGRLAKRLGFQAVEMSDENGTSWLIVDGVPLKRADPANQTDPKFAANDDQPSFSQSAQGMAGRIRNLFTDDQASLKVFNAYDKTLSTQYNKALKDRDYGKVFDLVSAMQNLVSLSSIRPAERAPSVLPRVDDIKAAARTLIKGSGSIKDINKAADAIFAGTLAGDTVMQGVVWTEDELRSKFQMNDAQIALYQQSRSAIDASLDELAAAEGYAMSQGFAPKSTRQAVIDNPQQAQSILTAAIRKQIKMLDASIRLAQKNNAPAQLESLEATKREYEDTLRRVEQIFTTSKNLKQAGYAPLMRFGRFKVAVQAVDPDTGKLLRDDKNEVISLYFGKFEAEGEAQDALTEMREKFAGRDDVKIEAGEDSKLKNELYAGISPETIALFGEAVGYDEVTKTFYKEALTERSALKRRLERKGTAGYSNDLPRALSNFITSNSRHAAQRYYLRDLNNSIKKIPAARGGVTDEAVLLKKFVMNPNDPAAPMSSLLFAWFLGGSAAAALVNLTQPVLMTGPYLSQYGAGKAVKAMNKAMPYALGKKQITDSELRDALKRASQEGIVDAQEIFHLYSIGAQGVATGLVNALSKLPVVGNKVKAGGKDARARANAFLTLWGSMFSLAEQFNRKLTFLAAWEVAKQRGEKDPYAFAVRAVNETQGIYNKANRPNWARGPWGRVILTFKQFPIMYLELVTRMWKRGGPEGKRAALLMLAMLVIASGEEGLPFAQDLDDIIDTLGQIMGFDTNMRRDKRRMARKILGDFFGDMFLYGISSRLPLDFAGRLGVGNIIPGTSLIEPANENGRSREAADVFGPAAGLLGQVFDSIDAATEGNYGKAVQNLAPKAVKDVMAATEMATKGYSTDYKGRRVVDVTLADAAVKASGFNPTVVAQTTRKTMPIQQDIALQKRTESAIVDQWVRGIIDNDEKAIQSAIKRRDDWNKRNPDTQINIGPQQIKLRRQSMATDKDGRIIKQAPREMRGRVAEELQE